MGHTHVHPKCHQAPFPFSTIPSFWLEKLFSHPYIIDGCDTIKQIKNLYVLYRQFLGQIEIYVLWSFVVFLFIRVVRLVYGIIDGIPIPPLAAIFVPIFSYTNPEVYFSKKKKNEKKAKIQVFPLNFFGGTKFLH